MYVGAFLKKLKLSRTVTFMASEGVFRSGTWEKQAVCKLDRSRSPPRLLNFAIQSNRTLQVTLPF